MPTLPELLEKLESLNRQQVEIEYEIVDLKRCILAETKSVSKPHRKRSTNAETIAAIRGLVKVLKDAGEALPRREIASRLGLPAHQITYRLQRAIEARFVEKVAAGRYKVSNVVPAFD